MSIVANERSLRIFWSPPSASVSDFAIGEASWIGIGISCSFLAGARGGAVIVRDRLELSAVYLLVRGRS
jgi:hypothetical protein